MPITDPVLQFTFLITAALLVQLTVERFHLPGLIGLLAIGMLIGPGGAGVLPHGQIVEMLGEVGLIYVMFLAGVEIDLDVARAQPERTATFGLMSFGFTLVLGLSLGLAMEYGFAAALLLGALISSHTLITYPLIERLNLQGRPSVVTAISGTLVTDTLALLLLAMVMQTAGAAGGGIMQGLLPLVLLAALIAAALLSVPPISRYFFSRAWITQAEKALYVLVVLMLLATVAEVIGTEAILGAFLAGIALNQVLGKRDYLHEHIEFVGQLLFIPFFFISTGMLLELEVFFGAPSVWLMALILLGAVLVGKSAAAWLAGTRYGYSLRERFLMTSLTIPQAAATLAIAITANQAGFLDDHVVDAVIILIFLTCLAGALLTSHTGSRLEGEPDPSQESAGDPDTEAEKNIESGEREKPSDAE